MQFLVYQAEIRNVYAKGELLSESTIRKFWIVQQEGARQVARELDGDNPPVCRANDRQQLATLTHFSLENPLRATS
ncbi:MAG: hypothetical protein JZU64_18725 [Rhodoferax sp.]|nr:hypothetical protein [Rhodoferax sp.]